MHPLHRVRTSAHPTSLGPRNLFSDFDQFVIEQGLKRPTWKEPDFRSRASLYKAACKGVNAGIRSVTVNYEREKNQL
jgi:hypothetical protein